MKFLVCGCNKKKKGSSSEKLQRFLQSITSNITYTRDWISALNYVALNGYSAIWMDWDIIKDVYLKFHQKLHKLNRHVPLIILCEDTFVDGQLCISNDLVFCVERTDEVLRKGKNFINRLNIYLDLISELPGDIQSYLRPNGFGPFVGNSVSMLETYRQVARVAGTDFTVLILGESGSGKELVAQTIHELSPRKSHPFIFLNCAAIPENLMESELFGYEKGAFTGASQAKPGKFELADRGTIFLDEIGNMPPNLQAKLLRVLEDHTVERLGGTTSREVDIRLLAATNQDLEGLIQEGKFREDLYYRLEVIPINLQPISEKSEDIVLLTLHIIGNLMPGSAISVNSVSWDFIHLLQSNHMSGNIRELENILTRVLFYSNTTDLTEGSLNAVKNQATWNSKEEKAEVEDEVEPLWKVEKLAITHALSKLNGNISHIASQLGISRSALYRKMKRYQLSNHA